MSGNSGGNRRIPAAFAAVAGVVAGAVGGICHGGPGLATGRPRRGRLRRRGRGGEARRPAGARGDCRLPRRRPSRKASPTSPSRRRTAPTSTLAAFAGKTMLVNLWATWCVPCRAEMPALDRLQAAFGGKDFQVVAINVDLRNERAGPCLPRRDRRQRPGLLFRPDHRGLPHAEGPGARARAADHAPGRRKGLPDRRRRGPGGLGFGGQPRR